MRCTNPNCREAVCMNCNVGNTTPQQQILIGPNYGSEYAYPIKEDPDYEGGQCFTISKGIITFCPNCNAKDNIPTAYYNRWPFNVWDDDSLSPQDKIGSRVPRHLPYVWEAFKLNGKTVYIACQVLQATIFRCF